MRWLYIAAVLTLAVAAPAPAPAPAPSAAPEADAADDNRPEIIEIIAPAASAQETLNTLQLGAPGSDLSERNKRTIGILRQLFPTLTQIIEQKVQQLTSMVLTTFGPVVLRAFLGNRGGAGSSPGTGGGTVELDDDDDDDDDDAEVASSTTEVVARRRRGAADESQLLSGAESQQAEVRVAFSGEQQSDQETAAQTNAANIDEISLDDGDDSEENRNKRFLNFGVGGEASAGGSGGGSGNFLFDIVRSAPAAMARAAGATWRLLSSPGSLSLGLQADHTALVAGSSSGSSGVGEAAVEGEAAKGDNLTEGVPGPITRLFIIANRGIANLIQDLILRLAQTSERIVNFKARLITSII